MKIIDCFTFYNELVMLKFRLEYLYDTVDHFVIVEATRTHAGNSKPLFFEQNKSMFAKYLNKIVHIVVSDMPVAMIFQKKSKIDYTLRRESYQRHCIHRGIQSLGLSADDRIIISDCDEIPDKHTIKNADVNTLYSLEQDLYYYNLTLKEKSKWTQAKICNYETYCKYDSPHSIRQQQISNILPNGGWHFSYFGNANFVVNKIRNFCHYDMFQHLSDTEIKQKIDDGTLFKDIIVSADLVKIAIKENTYLPEGCEELISLTK